MTVGSKGIKTEMRGSYIILKGRWSCIVCINMSKRCCVCPVPELRCRLNLWMNVVIVNCWVHESRSSRISLQRSSHNTVLYYRPHRVHFTVFVSARVQGLSSVMDWRWRHQIVSSLQLAACLLSILQKTSGSNNSALWKRSKDTSCVLHCQQIIDLTDCFEFSLWDSLKEMWNILPHLPGSVIRCGYREVLII